MEFDKNSTKVWKKVWKMLSKMKILHILFIKQIFQHFHFHECVGVYVFAMENNMENCDFGLENVWKK